MKTFLTGLWVLAVALGGAYAAATFGGGANPAAAVAEKPILQLEKTRVLNVPIISGGAVRGFIVAQFNYTVDSGKAKGLTVSPEAFLLDEAFRAIYTDDRLDFLHLDKYDVNGLLVRLAAATNRRLGAAVVHDVLVQDFTFISREENER